MQVVFIVLREAFPEYYIADVFANRPLAEKFIQRERDNEASEELKKKYIIQEFQIKEEIK